MRGRRRGIVGGALVTSLLLVSVLLIGASAPTPGTGPSVVVVGSTTTVQPSEHPVGPVGATLTAAKNEFESFQVVIEAGSTTLTGVDVSLSNALTSVSGSSIPSTNVTIYREAYYEVITPSDAEGATGLWPDALIPERDVFYGETRDAFPIDVPPGENRAAWVDVLVPKDQEAGTYSGSLTVSAAGGFQATVPIDLTVLDFTIPSTPTLDSTFGFASFVCPAHFGDSGCSLPQRWALNSLYIRAGLEDRISISPPQYGDAPTTPVTRRLFKRYILPFLRGSSPQNHAGTWTKVRLPGARLQSILVGFLPFHIGGDGTCCVPNPPDNNPCLKKCLTAYRSLARKYGFADRLLILPRDEPSKNPENWAMFLRNRRIAIGLFPELKDHGVLVTSPIQYADQHHATNRIDIMAVLVNFMDGKSGFPPYEDFAGNQRLNYDPFLQSDPNNRVWLYTSCESYRCEDDPDDPYRDGWPGYAIDEPASQSRAMGWLQFIYGTTGELYYDVATTLRTAWQPGGQFYHESGNGDGNLFYPGIPDPAARGIAGIPAIGGTHDIPIESIRLKRIRDGEEDYEYLNFLAEHGQADAAMNIATKLFPEIYETTVSQDALTQARSQLITLIQQVLKSGSRSGP